MKLPDPPAFPVDAEGNDLAWHALNYRTAHTVHAEAMWKELEAYVRSYALQCMEMMREECARLCNEMSRDWIARGKSENWEFRAHGAEECAEAIREKTP